MPQFHRQGPPAEIRRSARQRREQQHPGGLQHQGQPLGGSGPDHRAPGRVRPLELQRLGAPQREPNLRLRRLQLGNLERKLKDELCHLA